MTYPYESLLPPDCWFWPPCCWPGWPWPWCPPIPSLLITAWPCVEFIADWPCAEEANSLALLKRSILRQSAGSLGR